MATEYKDFVFAGNGKRQFTLSDDSISLGKGRGKVTLSLNVLEPDYRTVRRRPEAFLVGLIGLVAGLVVLVYAIVFDSEDLAEVRSHPEQAETLLRRKVTVQVDHEPPVTGAVTGVRPADDFPDLVNGDLRLVHREAQLQINRKPKWYLLRDVIHAKADRTGFFAFAATCGAIGLLILCSAWRKVECAVFRSTTGVDAIAIARAGPDTSRFDLFVDELSRRIARARGEDGG